MQELLRRKRDEIVRGWIDAVFGIFPAESGGFLGKVRDPFANPMGSTIKEEIAFLFDALVRGAPDEELAPHLERIVRITCVQDVAPSRAIAFVFALRGIVRRALAVEQAERGLPAQLLCFESRIDRLALQAFDCYAGERQRIADLRVQEARNRVSTLVKMAGLRWDDLPSSVPYQGGRGR